MFGSQGLSSVVFVTISFRASWRGHLWKVSRGLFVMALLIPQCVGPTMSHDTTGRQVKIKMDGVPLFRMFSESYPSRPLFNIYSPCLGFPGEGPTGAFSFISANVSSCPKHRDHIASFSAYDSNGVAAMFLQESRVPTEESCCVLAEIINSSGLDLIYPWVLNLLFLESAELQLLSEKTYHISKSRYPVTFP